MIIIPRRYITPVPKELRQYLSRGMAASCEVDFVPRWEEEFANFIGCRFAVAVGSGRLAMKLLLASLNLPKGAEIVIPAYTLKDLIPIITALDLVPVAADIDPEHWNISAATVVPVLSKKTKAIIVLHLFGNPAPMAELQALAKEFELMLVEDCAHSAGSTIVDKPTGFGGIGAFFSFESIKPINTFGGGMVVTDDPELAARIRAESSSLPPFSGLKRKIKTADFEHLMFKTGLAFFPLYILSHPHGQKLVSRLYRFLQPPPRIPCGYSGVQAKLGIYRLSSLVERIAERRRQAAFLTSMLPRTCKPQKVISGCAHNYYFFVIRYAGDAQWLRRRLLFHRYDVGYGPEIADDCSVFLSGLPCPNAHLLQKQALHLPLHEGISDRQLARLAEIIAAA